ncbi:DUF5329 family protein [Microbulbifer sp. JMSA004]|uniref:DUF5329 domain-containing protein n=1 Tax=unclassified Microbulbifer TaxID=2619833 RepID=UPI0024ADBA6C|nr:DUF5329 domain-containing protein [Microbulbifer sp. VAAF005]WHI45605.1 DUF5329 domain-containing protein [Microbulbifer sp. VAAF005]
MIKSLSNSLTILSLSMLPALVQADTATKEINHLMEFVSASECTFIRNDSKHTSQEAVEHMEKKYKYFSNKIVSAEDFIKLSASASTFSGKPYHIQCADQPKEESQQWLLDELARYRETIQLTPDNT